MLAARFGLRLQTDATGVGTLADAGPAQLAFSPTCVIASQLVDTRAGVVVARGRCAGPLRSALIARDPEAAHAKSLRCLN